VSLRVLMSADAAGGALSQALLLARALQKREVRVVLAVMGGSPSRAEREEAGRIPGLSLHESACRLEWMDPWDDVARAGAWLLDLEDRTRPDVVQLSGLAHGALPFRAPRVVVTRGCALSWFEAVFGTEPPLRLDRCHHEATQGLAGALSVLEAALEGCALVLGDIPSVRALWGGTALFVDPDDADDLGRALRCLILHAGVRTALGARARSRALDCSLERMALGYLAVHDEVCARPRTEPPRALSTIPPPRMDAAVARR
jgi:glycosyltransferase involved in cell wall biosynthesis